MDEVIKIRRLSKRREQAGARFELNIPEADFHRGKLYGVVGASGSGKSTLLDMLALVLRPSSADRFSLAPSFGKPLDIIQLWDSSGADELAGVRREHFGYVLQAGGLIGFLSVRDNLALSYKLLGKRIDHDRIEMLCSEFGISAELPKKPRFLSGGQRQRVAILRALMQRPTVVLADEPTAALDQVRARQVIAEFKSLALQAGSTVIIVSHDKELLMTVADHLLELKPALGADGTAVSTAEWLN